MFLLFFFATNRSRSSIITFGKIVGNLTPSSISCKEVLNNIIMECLFMFSKLKAYNHHHVFFVFIENWKKAGKSTFYKDDMIENTLLIRCTDSLHLIGQSSPLIIRGIDRSKDKLK